MAWAAKNRKSAIVNRKSTWLAPPFSPSLRGRTAAAIFNAVFLFPPTQISQIYTVLIIVYLITMSRNLTADERRWTQMKSEIRNRKS